MQDRSLIAARLLYFRQVASFESLAVENSKTPFITDDKGIAQELKMSLAWVRKDRATKRLVPFFRIGDCVRYDVETVRKAFLSRMEGGAK